MPRVTIADVANAAGMSVATVDRVLNGRRKVRALTAERVLKAANDLKYHSTSLFRQRMRDSMPEVRFGFLLQKKSKVFYRELARDLRTAVSERTNVRGKIEISYVDELSPEVIAKAMRELAPKVDVLGVVAIDHPHISEEIEVIRSRGVPTISIIADVSAGAKSAHVGIDPRQTGRTAAWAISRLSKQPGKVGVLVGSHRYQNHEGRESSFRSFFRESGSGFQVLDPIVYLDDSAVAQSAMANLVSANPDIVGCYLIGGGVEGALKALREANLAEPMTLVCSEFTPASRSGLLEGLIDFVIATPTDRLSKQTVSVMTALALREPLEADNYVVPFEIYTSENV